MGNVYLKECPPYNDDERQEKHSNFSVHPKVDVIINHRGVNSQLSQYPFSHQGPCHCLSPRVASANLGGRQCVSLLGICTTTGSLSLFVPCKFSDFCKALLMKIRKSLET